MNDDRHLHFAARMSAGKVDTVYGIVGRWADACVCGAPTAPGSVWCARCQAYTERLIAFAHSRICLSCRAASNGPLCAACAETGEIAFPGLAEPWGIEPWQ